MFDLIDELQDLVDDKRERAAARFMHQFGVDMTQHPNYVAMKPYWEST